MMQGLKKFKFTLWLLFFGPSSYELQNYRSNYFFG